MRRAALFLSPLLVLSLSSSVALGEESPASSADEAIAPTENAQKEQARAHFEKALTLFEEEAWDAALVEFLASRELYPTRAATKNAAVCLRKLHRFDQALDYFEALLQDFPDLPSDEKSLVVREMRELQGRVGGLEIRDALPGAKVVVDGRERGIVPLSPLRLPVGTHLLRVSMEGFAPFEAQVDVIGGQTVPVTAELSALTQGGRLKITEQEGKVLDVVVDGIVVGKTPWEGTLAVGDHMVLLQGEGNVGTPPVPAPVSLNQVTPLTLRAELLDASLRIEPMPAGAHIAIDGVTVGRGLWEGRLRSGSHKIEVASEGFLPITRQLSLRGGEPEVLRVSLERDRSSEAFRAANPPRIVVEASGALALSPTLGGDLVAGCGDGCTASTPMGGFGRIHVAYQLGWGLGFGIDAGALTLSQRVENRTTELQPVGRPALPGVVEDQLRLSGALLGASASYRLGTDTFPLTARLGAGAFLGTTRDEREGSFTRNDQAPLAVRPPAEQSPSTYLYVSPEAMLGYRVGERFEVSVGLQALVFLGIGESLVWENRAKLIDPVDGVKTFPPNETVAGETIVIVLPSVGARYEF